MQALKLSKKYPEFKQDEIFDLVNKFKYVRVFLEAFYLLPVHSSPPLCPALSGSDDSGHVAVMSFRKYAPNSADNRQIDVDDKGSLDKAAVIAALGQSGDADYDSVSTLHLISRLS